MFKVWIVAIVVAMATTNLCADEPNSATAIGPQSKSDPLRHDYRTWTDSTGTHQTEATFSGLESGKVKLQKRDGNTVTIPLEKLGKADQKWVLETMKATSKASEPLSYKITKENTDENFHSLGIKRVVDVRLDGRVAEETLRRIAVAIKESDPKKYERTLYSFYLPGEDRPWATARYEAELTIRIIGSTAAEGALLKATPSTESTRRTLGSWLDRDTLHQRITIYRQDGKLFMEDKFPDGSVDTKELVCHGAR